MSETVLAPEVFDRLQEAMASDPPGLTELYRDFLAEAWNAMRLLRYAVQQHQPRELFEKAHYLKGSSQVLGARDLAGRAIALEDMGRKADFAGAEAALEHVGQAIRNVQRELSERLGPSVIPEGQAAA